MRLVLVLVATLIPMIGQAAPKRDATAATVSVCFTPGEDCEGQIVRALDASRISIKVQAYGFTSEPIIHALQRAAARNVDVLAILDKVNDRKYSAATLLQAKGIPVWIDSQPKIAHNKIMIIDDVLVIGGSFNYTTSAQQRNAENVTFTESRKLAEKFTENWNRRLQASKPFGD